MTDAERMAEKEFARKVFLEYFEGELAGETDPEQIARLKNYIEKIKKA